MNTLNGGEHSGNNVDFHEFMAVPLPYHLSGQIEHAEDLVLMSPEEFQRQYNIDARVNQEVVSIDRANKEVEVKDLVSGETYKESYDKLILSPGAKPIVPRIPGIEKANVFTATLANVSMSLRQQSSLEQRCKTCVI